MAGSFGDPHGQTLTSHLPGSILCNEACSDFTVRKYNFLKYA